MDNHFQRRSMPPPPPPPVSPPEHDQDISLHDRYRRLKRRFIEMEQKFSAMYVDLQRAGEQNRRLARERDMLLDRIHEMNVLPTSPTSPASASLSTSTRPQMDRYVSRSAPPPIRSAREAALQRFLDEDSDDDVPPPPPRRPSVDDYDRREFSVNGNENGNRSNPIPDRDRYSYPPPPPPLPPPAGPVHSTSSRPIYSPESTPTSYPRYQSSAPPAIQNQLQNYHNPASTQSNHLHHSHHPPPPPQSQHPNSIHEPYYSPYVHSGPRSRTPPPPVSPPSEYSWRKRPLERDEEVTSGKRVRTSQYQHQQQPPPPHSGSGASGSLPKPVSSTSSQSGGAFVNGSPSPPIQGAVNRGGSGGGNGARGKGGGRSRKGRAGSVSASSTTEAPIRKHRARQTNKPTRDPSAMPDDELDLERRNTNYGIDTSVPGSSSVATLSSSARPGSVKQRSLSPPIPPPSMPTNIVRGGSSPSRSYSPAPPALPPTGPPPRDRISPVANTRNSSRSNNAPPPPLPPLALPRPRSTKPKRLKAHTVQSKSYSIPTVPRNPDGKPQLPLNVGIMTVRNLGKVCLEKHFHTERYIFPVGYEVTRRYFSMHNPEAEAQYTCTILHGSDVDGGSGPRIVASDNAEHPITAGTATGAWSVIVKAANKLRMRPHSNSVSGPDYFGLGQNTIKHLLQELENANLLQDYVRQTFVEGGPLGGRHAAVTAAVNLDEKPPEASSSSSISHSRSHPHEHASKSSSPIDQRDDQERDGGSVIGADLDHEPEDGEGNEPEHISPPPPPSVRSPRRRSGSGQHDEEDDGHSYHHPLPPITKFDQQPPISHQRGSPTTTAPPSHSRSPYHSHSPPSGQGIREREREGERYGSSSSPSTLSGIRGLMNPPRVSSEGSRSEYSPNSRPGGGHGQGNPGDDYRDREEYRTTRMSTSPQ
ncbi:hypothetical protein Clacol_007600 [Clathrus columnatus]|uniref:Uncharacterized protein n=1 Tax=Clathrus columnatus TaxID=1419009 RepID=A0AAV5AKY5_9AGAM|nr:hypothetical protein Clacol_007600 [Clathrus columnatus]